MINIFKLANVIDKKVTTMQIEANLCTSVISPKSSCTSCVDHCPTNSIHFKTDGIEIDERCVECGLCTTVCPTSAIVSQRPSLHQFITKTIRACKHNERVYLHCGEVNPDIEDVVTVKVPCLGAIPREAWLTLTKQCENLTIYHPKDSCNQCEISKGEEIWRNELQAGQQMSENSLSVTPVIEQHEEQVTYDLNRRAFLSTLFDEVKSTNKLAIKEWFGGSKVQSYQEKLNEDPIYRMEKEWSTISTSVVEKITNEQSLPYMYKRNLLITEVKKDEVLQTRKDVRLPMILQGCNFCGACTILCPTDALQLEEENGKKTITLQPVKCVDCRLCEDICFFKSIQLQDEPNEKLLTDKILLVESIQ